MKNILLLLLLCILLFTINNNLRENFNIKDLGKKFNIKDLGNEFNNLKKNIESSILEIEKVFERSNFRILGFKNRELENCDNVEDLSKNLYNKMWNSEFINNEDSENKYKSKWKDYLYNEENAYKKLCYCNK